MVNDLLTRLQDQALSLKDMLASILKLKAPLRKLRVHQILQELLVTGRYQELLNDKAGVQATPEDMLELIERKLDEADQHSTIEYLDEYVIYWIDQAQSQMKSDEEIASNVGKMQAEWREQLCNQVESIGFDYNFFLMCSANTNLFFTYQIISEILKFKHTETLLDYLAGRASDEDTIQYIVNNGLESIIDVLQTEITNKIQELLARNNEAWNYVMNVPVI